MSDVNSQTAEQKLGRLKERAEALETDVGQLRHVVGTLISWIAQSSVSPLSQGEAQELLAILQRSAIEAAKP